MPSSRSVRRFLGLLGAAVTLLPSNVVAVGATQAPMTGATTSNHGVTCQHPHYQARIISRSPLVIYLIEFLTPHEREHLLNVTRSTFSRSGVTPSTGAGAAIHAVRTSQSATVPSSDPVSICIQQRALLFQGLSSTHHAPRIEPLQLVRYAPTQAYHFHTDWFTDPALATGRHGGNRASSFFAYVHVAEGTFGGGTNFPMLDAPTQDWCDEGWADCDAEWEDGWTFRAVEGNAVYWENLGDDTGTGDYRVLHAGLSVQGEKGGKVGLNIWTRQGPIDQKVRRGFV